MTLKERTKFLREVKTILDKAEIPFWLESGTLLGAIRDKDFIEYDKDIDISIMREYQEDIEVLDFSSVGTKGRHIHGDFMSSHYIIKDGYKIDIYYWTKVKDEYVSYTNAEFCTVVDKEYFDNLKKIKFKGMLVRVPNNPVQYLRDKYGDPDWTIEDPDWQENNQGTLKPLKDYIKYL